MNLEFAGLSGFKRDDAGCAEVFRSRGMQAALAAPTKKIEDECNEACAKDFKGADAKTKPFVSRVTVHAHTAIGQVSSWNRAGRTYQSKFNVLDGYVDKK